MVIYLATFLIGIASGLRAFTGVMAVSWAARLGWLHLENTYLAFLGFTYTPFVITILAIGELIGDKLPTTPSRKMPPAFAARVLTGAVCGAAIGGSAGNWAIGLILGVIGAIVGTIGGAEVRGRLAYFLRKDMPAAIIEDFVAVVASFLVLALLAK